MRRATGVTFQPHQILRLPCKMNLMIDPHHIWNVIYNARSYSQHTPTSPNTAPATQKESHDWSASHMKRYLHCAEQQSTPSNLTKYCACHAKRISWLIRITHETLFTMRGATVNTLQPHQILRLPRKKNLMMDPHHIWNVIYNARSNSPHPPTSPILPLPRKMTIQHLTEIWWKQLKRHFQCATDPTMIRAWSETDYYCYWLLLLLSQCHGIWVFQMYLGVSNWLDHWPKSHPPTHWNHGGVGRTINYNHKPSAVCCFHIDNNCSSP